MSTLEDGGYIFLINIPDILKTPIFIENGVPCFITMDGEYKPGELLPYLNGKTKNEAIDKLIKYLESIKD